MDFYKMLAEFYDEIFPLQEGLVKIVEEITESGGSIVDIGSASGTFVKTMTQKGYKVFGVEYEPTLVGFSQNTAVGDMHQLPFKDEVFDTLICTGNTLAHAHDLNGVIRVMDEFNRVLKKGGRVFIQILNYEKILRSRPEELPFIKTKNVIFERYYSYSKGSVHFKGVVKAGGAEHTSAVRLYPLRRTELVTACSIASFSVDIFYGGFDRSGFVADASFSLIALLTKG